MIQAESFAVDDHAQTYESGVPLVIRAVATHQGLTYYCVEDAATVWAKETGGRWVAHDDLQPAGNSH